jgi:hypothetical protein
MVCSGYTKVWELTPGEHVKLDSAQGTTLRVTRGALWLTQEHDTRDIVLSAGDSFTIDRRGLTLIEAQGNATVCVLARHVSEIRVRTPHAGVGQRLRTWLRSLGTAAADRKWVPYY